MLPMLPPGLWGCSLRPLVLDKQPLSAQDFSICKKKQLYSVLSGVLIIWKNFIIPCEWCSKEIGGCSITPKNTASVMQIELKPVFCAPRSQVTHKSCRPSGSLASAVMKRKKSWAVSWTLTIWRGSSTCCLLPWAWACWSLLGNISSTGNYDIQSTNQSAWTSS